jgi:acetyl-CoA carboxylase carboxyl transferase subunit alpha
MGIGVGDKVYMMENTWYTVISPESCSSILWRSWDHKEKAADELKLTSEHMLGFGLVDGIIPEPLGGAHWNHDEAAAMMKEQVVKAIAELKEIDPETRIDQRIEKFSNMGRWEENTNQVS